MRWLYLTLAVLLVLATAAFALQNLQAVDVSFLRMRIRLPLAFVIGAIYALGALTGAGLLALLRHTLAKAQLSK